ncbi:cytochrome c oxidase subunit 4 [Brachybacterium massiliense]|uniref:aa3-type cytochrome oxidase subunit IV n=1 Tax=Brachybacterium massiliense TaxID=1755098 RepID=UPI000B3BCE5C|nr:cytochrome c oxidase subunit 4 [Brachybacterium massiliense]
MRATAKIFWILTVFFAIVAAAYAFVTSRYEPMGMEMVGVPAIIGLAGLALMIALTASIAVKKNDLGASDELDGEVSDDAGVQGSFSPYSWAPLWASLGASLCFLGVAAGWWIFAFGVMFAIYGVILWVMEFSTGQHAH